MGKRPRQKKMGSVGSEVMSEIGRTVEELEMRGMRTGMEILSQEHPDTLTSMAILRVHGLSRLFHSLGRASANTKVVREILWILCTVLLHINFSSLSDKTCFKSRGRI